MVKFKAANSVDAALLKYLFISKKPIDNRKNEIQFVSNEFFRIKISFLLKSC